MHWSSTIKLSIMYTCPDDQIQDNHVKLLRVHEAMKPKANIYTPNAQILSINLQLVLCNDWLFCSLTNWRKSKKSSRRHSTPKQAIYEVVITKQKQTSQTCMCKIVYFIFTD